jgi:4-amino-4-deoxy-L-arabinose transferase-like glycosyltransferase
VLHQGKKLWLIVLVAAAVRLYLVFSAAGINSDAYMYALTVQRMARQGVLAGMRGDLFVPFYQLNKGLVVYPLLGSLLYRITGDAILSLRLVSAAAGVGLVLLSYAACREIFEEANVGLLSAGLLALHPEFTRASAAVYREMLAAFLVLSSLYCVIRAGRSGRRWYAWTALSGLLCFASFLTRPDGILALAAAGVYVLFLVRQWPPARRVASVAVLGAVFCVLQLPYTLWMRGETGYWLLNQYQTVQTPGGSAERTAAAVANSACGEER